MTTSKRSSHLDYVISAGNQYQKFFCKFISANDAGLTDTHQDGIYLAKSSWPLFFDSSGEKSENKDRVVSVYWEEGCPPVQSRLVWYGRGTRSEYRITRFWPNSPYDKKDCVGDLLILIPINKNEVIASLLRTEEDVETFLSSFSISLIKNFSVYGVTPPGTKTKAALTEEQIIAEYALLFDGKFPVSQNMATAAREINNRLKRVNLGAPDHALLKWIDVEYKLFKSIEDFAYKDILIKPFESVGQMIEFSSGVLNRRKSRAGRSFEHHIDFLLTSWGIPFSHPGRTEGKKKPDFIFPSNDAYADYTFDNKLLTFLGAKTTCKDRWRQILNEANRIPVKHLITLQQGISENQMEEMKSENVILVVPRQYHEMYPPKFQPDLVDVTTFFQELRSKST